MHVFQFLKEEKFKIANPTGLHSVPGNGQQFTGLRVQTPKLAENLQNLSLHTYQSSSFLLVGRLYLFVVVDNVFLYPLRPWCCFRGLQFLHHAPCKWQTTELEFTTVNDILSFCLRTSFEGVRLLSTRCRVTTSTRLPKSRC